MGDGILTGDHVIEINGQSVAGLQLGELMELIKNIGDILNLTTINESEFEAAEQNDKVEHDLKQTLQEEHIEGLNIEQEPAQEESAPIEVSAPEPEKEAEPE